MPARRPGDRKMKPSSLTYGPRCPKMTIADELIIDGKVSFHLKVRIPKISLVRKLIAGFVAMALFTMATLIFAISGLYSLNKTARDIAKNDLVLLRSASTLRQSILAQE